MPAQFPKIDAHQHFWQLDRYDYAWLQADRLQPIRRDFLPEDLLPELQACGIQQSVFVQTQHHLDETLWVLELAQQHDFLAGVVGWVDLASAECEQQVQQLLQFPKFVGVRHVTHDEPDPDFILRPEVLQGLGILQQYEVPFDLLFYVQHLQHAATLAQQLPELKMVIDHLSKPRIGARGFDDWLPNMRSAAQYPHVYCKLSGLVTEANWHQWRVDEFRPYFDAVLELFGPRRIMYGSDWPVCLLSASYQQVYHLAEALVESLSDSERAQIWSGTAREFYGLAGVAAK